MRSSTQVAALFAGIAAAAHEKGTFAVLRFNTAPGKGLTEGRSDPIVNFGQISPHVHTIQGGNAFSNSARGEDLMKSTCSTAKVAGDMSAYWAPNVYFHDRSNSSFEKVTLNYMNVYYL